MCRSITSLFLLLLLVQLAANSGYAQRVLEPSDTTLRAIDADPRPADNDLELKRWLQNMVWYHRFSTDEIRQATGLNSASIEGALIRFAIAAPTTPDRTADAPLLVMPYPGGRHPRIGFLDGAIRPQRDTKVSVFTPWDQSSYVVLDIPEAIWSNLGLTYLAHTHIDTVWTKQNIGLPKIEWERRADGSLLSRRILPNQIIFGTKVIPHRDHIQMEMWLFNGSKQTLRDLRVQNCVMLKAARGFEQQSNDNKVLRGPYAACRSNDGGRWIISAWDPSHRTWANPPCPCLHSDPKFPDCEPGQTQYLRGWLSFYEGTDIGTELARIDETGWQRKPISQKGKLTQVTGRITDASTGEVIPARVHVRDAAGQWRLAESADPSGSAVHYYKSPRNMPNSSEVHTTLSAHEFRLDLPPGDYDLRIERGKEYLPLQRHLVVGLEPIALDLPLQRWINMSDRGWYSGDTHVHRSLEDLPNVMLAEDLNVALPLTYWVRDAGVSPADASRDQMPPTNPRLISVDATHVIHPINTEYEIFSVGERRHTLGAVFVLNHKEPLDLATPPTAPIAEAARRQGALLDLDKHSWPWSLMIVPIMDVDLFELANNHLWQTNFGFTRWTLETVPAYMNLKMDDRGLTEWGWTDFGFQTYYALLNCGLRLRVSAGTASGVHPVQLGFGRVYVHLPDGFSYDEWMKGLDAGRSFVSTGPMLEVTFNGEDPGQWFSPGRKAKQFAVDVDVVATSRRELDRIEVVINGGVAIRIDPPNQPTVLGAFESRMKTKVELDESAWVVVRCFERHTEDRVRFAHTNPIFVDFPDSPIRPRKAEVSYLIKRMQEEIERNRAVLTGASLDEYREAERFFKAVQKTAR